MIRRDFFGLLGGAAIAAKAGTGPHHTFPTEARARIGVASYPFRKDVDVKHGTMPLLDFPKMVVERFQVHAIEPLDEHFASTDADYLRKFRAALDAASVRVINIPVGVLGGSFYDTDPRKQQRAIVNAKKWVDVAAKIGSPSIRAHVQGVKGMPPNVERAAQGLSEVARYGSGKNIVVNLENDDPASEDAFFLVKVMERVNSIWLRALPDFCNSMLLNQGDDYNYRAVAAMFQQAYNICHVKTLEVEGGKTYRIDLAKTFDLAKQAGYKGCFSMEWDSPGDPYEGTQSLIDATLKNLSA